MIDNLTEAIEKYKQFAECETESARVLRNVGNEKDAKYFEETAENDKKTAEWLTELQKRREADRWIPVSERLPEDRKKVRVTAYWHERFQVMDASYYGDGVWWCVPFNNCGKHMRNDLHVIAWKPDDEPYESETENGTDS